MIPLLKLDNKEVQSKGTFGKFLERLNSLGVAERISVSITIALIASLLAWWLLGLASVQRLIETYTQQQPLDIENIRMMPEIWARMSIGIIVSGIVACLSPLMYRRQSVFFQTFFALTIIGLTFVRLLQYPVGCDDVYHDYRYVLNLATRHTLDYNPPEHVMGFTSHLHILLLSLLSIVTQCKQIDLLSPCFNMVLDTASFVMIVNLLKRLTRSSSLGLIAGFVFAFSPYAINEVWTGKETSLVTLLAIASLTALHSRRLQLFAWTCALLFLARPEGIFWLTCGFLWMRKYFSKALFRSWLVPILVCGGWFAFLYWYFGTVMPQGAIGRAHMFHSKYSPGDSTPGFLLSTIGTSCLGYLVVPLVSPIEFVLSYTRFIPVWCAQACYLGKTVTSLVALGFLRAAGERRACLRFYFYCLSAILLFQIAMNPWTYSWYASWYSLLPSIVVPYAIMFLEKLVRKQPQLGLTKIVAYSIATYLVIQGPLLTHTLLQWDDSQSRLMQYKIAANMFDRLAFPPKEIATIEPGVMGYCLPTVKMLDLGGLLSKEAVAFFPVPLNERTEAKVWCSIPPKAVLALKPDFIVFFDCFAQNGVLNNREFLTQYQLVYFWRAKVWGSNGLYAYKKRIRPEPEED